jgi:hypothetical protein
MKYESQSGRMGILQKKDDVAEIILPPAIISSHDFLKTYQVKDGSAGKVIW